MTGYRPPPPRTTAWVQHAVGGVVERYTRLVGGITADIDRVVMRLPSGTETSFVLRRWTSTATWTNGQVDRESAALRLLAGTDVPAPRLVDADPTGARAGVRCLLMTALPGEPLLAPDDLPSWLDRLAVMQSRIHAVDTDVPPTDQRADEPDDPGEPGWIADAGLGRAARAAALVAPTDLGFVHGDYQHFNVLWLDATISGVVDWPNAGVGSRGSDVGHCMLNVAVLHSADAAELYLASYESAAGVRVDTGAVLRALLAWGPDWQEFIPVQVAGRAPLDVAGMPGRVAETVRRVAARLG